MDSLGVERANLSAALPNTFPAEGRRYIVNHLAGSIDQVFFNPTARDNCAEPYIKLRQRCAEYGYAFEGVRDQPLEACRWIIFWDTWGVGLTSASDRLRHWLKVRVSRLPGRDLFSEVLRAGASDRLVLFMFEPPSVYPRNYDRELHRAFKIIFTWDPNLVDGHRYHRIYLPNPTAFPLVRTMPFSDRKLLVDISSYKFSNHERELFTERRQLVRFLEEHFADRFDLYGEGWNPSLRKYLLRRLRNPKMRWEHFPSYRHPVANKWDIYPRYRFGVCYENIRDQPGYISLKIFDCMRSGCVPIYLGAPDITDYVDPDAFVDRRAFSSNEELARFITGVTEAEHGRYLEAGREFLRSPRFAPFLSEHFVDTVVSGLGLARGRMATLSTGCNVES